MYSHKVNDLKLFQKRRLTKHPMLSEFSKPHMKGLQNILMAHTKCWNGALGACPLATTVLHVYSNLQLKSAISYRVTGVLMSEYLNMQKCRKVCNYSSPVSLKVQISVERLFCHGNCIPAHFKQAMEKLQSDVGSNFSEDDLSV